MYRDLKPENVFLDGSGHARLGDFGFAKVLEGGRRTYTFCGTPGYVAPENVLAHGYTASVDWWGLGVLAYVLLTGRQPFSSPSTEDPMVIMRRIVDENYGVKYPSYLSPAARDLVGRLLERRPAKRLGMLQGRAADVKRHRCVVGWGAAGGGRGRGACDCRLLPTAPGPPLLGGACSHAAITERKYLTWRCRWFEGFDWEALAARRMDPPRRPRDDATKRIRELAVRRAGGWRGMHGWRRWGFCCTAGGILVLGVERVSHSNWRLWEAPG